MKDAVVVGVLAFLGTVAVLVAQAWLIMLTVGALHSSAPFVPTLSFNASLRLVVLSYLVVYPATAVARSK